LLFDEKGEATKAALAYMDKVEVYAAQNLVDTVRRGLAGWVVKNRQPVLVSDTLGDARWLKRPWEKKNGSRSAISVPMVSSDKVLGVLTLVHPTADWFTRNDLALLASITMYITILALAPPNVDASEFAPQQAVGD
jgi:GAF domain-containing protein